MKSHSIKGMPVSIQNYIITSFSGLPL